ncbi:ubiquinol-cytochrome c reductase iron-sulfur subunit [Methanosarcina sp. Mfa9]|uniref:QcrA and Rieske domain-containing protein n=1 Tax=Methanosarcina sp. Mfa9 TaxID=3439063 RepID=UPI003F853ACE
MKSKGFFQSITATLKYVNQEPEISSGAYSISGNKIEVSLDRVPELEYVGNAVSIMDDSLPDSIIIARPEKDKYVVVSSKCAHRGRALAYEHDKKVFRCSSLGHSEFNLDGSKTKGPAGEGIKIYGYSIDGDKMTIELD